MDYSLLLSNSQEKFEQCWELYQKMKANNIKPGKIDRFSE
jgi:hypothetical protein